MRVSEELLEEYEEKWQPAEGFVLFHTEHKNALIYLIEKINLDPNDAISEINELQRLQAELLQEFYLQGLRGRHLRAWELKEGYWFFTNSHVDAVRNLISNGLSPEEAVKKINKLSPSEADQLVSECLKSNDKSDTIDSEIGNEKPFRIPSTTYNLLLKPLNISSMQFGEEEAKPNTFIINKPTVLQKSMLGGFQTSEEDGNESMNTQIIDDKPTPLQNSLSLGFKR